MIGLFGLAGLAGVLSGLHGGRLHDRGWSLPATGAAWVLALGAFAVAVLLVGLVWAVGRRYLQRPYRIRIKTKPEDAAILADDPERNFAGNVCAQRGQECAGEIRCFRRRSSP